MIIAGAGFKQDVTMENVDIKPGPETGAVGKAGSVASLHLLYFVILSVFRTVCGSIFRRLQAVGRFVRYPQERRTGRTSVLLLPTLCLALALVLFGGAGAVAQECNGSPTDPPSCNNRVPVANAGVDRTVNSGAMVTLDGSGSTDPDGNETIEKYEWTQPGQPAGWTGSPVSRVTLTGDDTEMPTFTADNLDAADAIAEVSHYFQLKVTDNEGETHIDTVTITVNAPPLAKIIGLAERRVNSGAMVTLDGSDSDDRPSGDVSYEWERTGGTMGITAPVLTDTTSETLKFTADSLDPGDAERTHEYTLTVTEVGITGRDAQSNAAIVTITVNAPPLANAGGGQKINAAETAGTVTATLDGSASRDTDGGTLEYSWVRTGGTSMSVPSLTGATSDTLTFPVDTIVPGDFDVTHEYRLTVTDAEGLTDTDTVTITINALPVANAGPNRTVPSGTLVRFDGSGSSDTGKTLDYFWEGPSGTSTSTAVLTGERTENPHYTAMDSTATQAVPKTNIWRLTVTDDNGATATDLVTITIEEAIAAPVARVDDGSPLRIVNPGDMAQQLASTGTVDRRRTISSYNWVRTGGTGTAGDLTLTGTNMAMATFGVAANRPTAGNDDETHEITLTVTDSAGDTGTAMVTITVQADPLANAGADQRIQSGTMTSPVTVTLDSSGSRVGAGRTIVSREWEQLVSDPRNTADALPVGYPAPKAGDSSMSTFTAQTLDPGDAEVRYVFELIVEDSSENTATDRVEITVYSQNALPVATVTPLEITVDPGDPVSLGSTVTDSDGTIASWTWTRTGGNGQANIPLTRTATGENTATLNLTLGFIAEQLDAGGSDVTHVFTLVATDNDSAKSAPVVVTVTVQADPLANAGVDRRIQSGTMTSPVTVTLDSSGSRVGAGRTIVSREWEQLVSDPRNTADALPVGYPAPKAGDSSMSTFTAQTLDPGDAEVRYVFELIVEDSSENTATDRVEITVYSQNALPVATVTPLEITVDPGDPVSLGSTVTDSDGTIASWTWTRTGGNGQANIPLTRTATGENTATLNLTLGFIAEQLDAGGSDVTHVFTLVATDNDSAESAPVVVTVTVQAPPFANAGPDQPEPGRPPILSGATVTLDGSGSRVDSDRTIASWAWTRPDGAAGGTADALPPDGQTGGLMGGTTAMPSFTAQTLMPGVPDVTYILTLTVTDNRGETSTDNVRITVTAPNQVPVANAGNDRSVASGAMVQLDGSGSMDPDDDGEIVSYRWTRKSGAAGGTADALPPNGQTGGLINANTATPGFTAQKLEPGDTDVTYILELVVTDNENAMSEPDTVIITVTAVLVDIETSPSELTVQEGSSGVYQVKLGRSPGQEVELRAYSDHEDVILENTRLVFNAENWNTWQDIRLAAVADADTENDMATIRHSLVTEGVAVGRSGKVRVTIRDADPILPHIGTYLETRAVTLLNNQPELIRFLRQDGTTPDSNGEFTFRATNGHLVLDGGFVHEGVWGEITGSYANSDSGDMKLTTGSFGFHRKYFGNLLGGVLLQFDFVDHDLNENNGTIDGSGWMFGPYFVARHDNWPLYFEGRLLYGQSDNRIRFNDPDFKTRTGSFDTHRTLAQLRMEGDIPVPGGNDALRLIPYADGRWIEDRAAAFTTGSETGFGMISVSGQKVSVGELELGSNLEVPIAMRHGGMTVTGGLGLVYSKTKGDHIGSESRNRGRGEIGFSYDVDDALRIDFDSFYDGIGTSRYESYGVSLNARMRF